MSANKLVIALDVGGSSIKSGVVGSNDSLTGESFLTPIDSSAPAQEIIDKLSGVIRERLATVNREDLLGIAIGFPGPFDYANGVCLIEGLCKFGSIYGVNVRDALSAALGLGDCPIVFRNDAEAAIMGEAIYGAGRQFSRLIGITIGTGFGSCFVVDGAPVMLGAGVPPNGWLYPLPYRDARIDDWFCTRGIQRRLRESGSPITDVAESADAARNGDAICRKAWEDFGAELAEILEPVVREFKAEAVLVLGRIAEAADLFSATMTLSTGVPILVPKSRTEAALLGVAELLLDRYQSQC